MRALGIAALWGLASLMLGAAFLSWQAIQTAPPVASFIEATDVAAARVVGVIPGAPPQDSVPLPDWIQVELSDYNPETAAWMRVRRWLPIDKNTPEGKAGHKLWLAMLAKYTGAGE